VTAYTPPPRNALSEAGRRTIAEAVSVDHDWNRPYSGVDKLIAALGALSDDDLKTAAALVYHLSEAVACVQIRRDMARDRSAA
jgi:hypothetical protein